MADIIGKIVNYLFGFLGIVIAGSIAVRFIYNHLTSEKKENAVVINKQCFDRRIYRKHASSYTSKEYVIIFCAGNKKRYFNVSELTFFSVEIGQKGFLIYKGNKFVDFEKRG